MDEMLKLIGNFGFPIVVSAYLLVRIEGKLKRAHGQYHGTCQGHCRHKVISRGSTLAQVVRSIT